MQDVVTFEPRYAAQLLWVSVAQRYSVRLVYERSSVHDNYSETFRVACRIADRIKIFRDHDIIVYF